MYQLDAEGPADDDEGEEGTPAYREWALPAAEFHGLWEALVRALLLLPLLLGQAAGSLLAAAAALPAQHP